MLKHIVPSQLRLGMYIHALDGSWLSHGFWKSSFRLKTTADLQRLQASGIAGLWIDLARGLDVQPAAIAGAIFIAVSTIGEFHGTIAPTTPIGSFTV